LVTFQAPEMRLRHAQPVDRGLHEQHWRSSRMAGYTCDGAAITTSQMVNQTPTSLACEGDLMTAKGRQGKRILMFFG